LLFIAHGVIFDYSAHPVPRPAGQLSAVQNRSRRFCPPLGTIVSGTPAVPETRSAISKKHGTKTLTGSASRLRCACATGFAICDTKKATKPKRQTTTQPTHAANRDKQAKIPVQ